MYSDLWDTGLDTFRNLDPAYLFAVHRGRRACQTDAIVSQERLREAPRARSFLSELLGAAEDEGETDRIN